MASLADEIEKLSDPRPKLLDPEDDINTETAARLVERYDEDCISQSESSSLRKKTAPLLEDIDARYTGKRISRKAFDQVCGAGKESSSEGEGSEEDGTTDEDLKRFKELILDKVNAENRYTYSDELECSRSSESGSSVSESEEDEEDEGSDSDDASGENDTDVESDGHLETEEDMFKTLSNIDVNEEIEKGKAVEAQLGLWNKFCECRIRLQKILTAANRLPQFDVWDDFKEKGDKNYSEAVERGPIVLKSVLDSMLELQLQLLLNNPETKSSFTTDGNLPVQESDEEIASDSESESKMAVKNENCPSLGEIKKRKLSLDGYSDVLTKRFKAFLPYRNSVIQKWDSKTRLTSGRVTDKSFSAFNQSALKQIDQILQDKQRLIRRTQLKRSVYSILGKNEGADDMCFAEEKSEEGLIKRNEHLKHYDPEIFDDDDFYQLLLKEVIESKTVGMDPDLLRMHMEIQKNRRKMKKKVDTKASKGRKIRYDPHPKMVSFMASIPYPVSYSEETRDDLFKRLFVQSSATHAL